MKTRITRKGLAGYKVFQCPYELLSRIMCVRDAQFYNAGVYGWNFDAYIIGDVAIVTGYRNTFGKRIPDAIIRKYTEIATQIIKASDTWEDTSDKLKKNIDDFVKEIQQ